MKTGSINFSVGSQVGIRFDATYHLSEGLIVKRKILSSPYEMYTIGDVSSDIFYGNRAKRVYVTKRERGIPFLSSSDILQADLDNVKLASKKYTPCIEQMTLKAGWTLISRSGTIGNCAFSNAKHAQKLASEHVIRLVPNNILRGGLVYAYLASRHGHSLLTQGTFGAVIQHIEPNFIASLPIPKFPESFQQEVDELIQESARLRELAIDSLERAVSYFDNLYILPSTTTKFFSKKLNQLGFSFAAYNNNLEVDKFVGQYIDNSFEIQEESTNVFAPPLFKHIYLSKDNGYPFMTGGELSKSNMRYYRWLSPRGVGDIKDYVVQEGTLLLYKSGSLDGMIGSVFIVDNTIDKCCLSDHVIRVIFPNKEVGYWTFAFLRSKGGVHLLKSLATGAAIPFITPERVSKLRIPKPDKNYVDVVKKVEYYISCISQSKIKENQAIRMVEEEIEKWNN